MIDEQALVAAILQDRGAYERIRGSLRAEDFSDQGRFVVERARAFYGRDESADCVDKSVLQSAADRHFPNPKHAAGIMDYVESLPAPASASNVASEYIALRRYNVGLELAARLGKGDAGHEVDSLIEKYLSLGEEETGDDDQPKLGIDELFDEELLGGGIKLFPHVLADNVGSGVSRGHNITIFGRPECGKSMLAITLAGGFLYQGLKVLYTGNEEPAAALQRRILSRLSGCTIPAMQADEATRTRAIERAKQRGYDNLAVKELGSGRPQELESLVTRYKPDVLIVDQLRNLKIPGEGNQAVQLDAAARAVRQLAIKHHIVTIGVTQAGNTADQKLVLGMADIDGSKTGIPGAADLLIGVGVDERADAQRRRMLSLCKNKVTGRHAKFWVYCDYERSAYLSKPPGEKGVR